MHKLNLNVIYARFTKNSNKRRPPYENFIKIYKLKDYPKIKL